MERSSHNLEAAEDRLRVLQDERAIRDTMARYGHSIDAGDDAGWLACFAPDGEYDILYGAHQVTRVELGTRHPGGVLHKGREQLAAFIAGHSRPPAGIHKHLLFEPLIVVDGDEATSTSGYLRADHFEGAPEVQSHGWYRDWWRRQADGSWVIQRREVDIRSVRR
jgi:hypothetical protein